MIDRGTYHIELAPYVRRFTNKEPWNVRVQWLACEVRYGAIRVVSAVSAACPLCPRLCCKSRQPKSVELEFEIIESGYTHF